MAKDNFYSSKAANSAAVIKAGLQHLASECNRLGAKTAWLVTPAKSNLDGFISEVVGGSASKALSQGKALKITETAELRFYTERTLPYSGDGGPILACYPEMNLMNKLDKLSDVPSLTVLPWTMELVQKWLDTHGPTDIFSKKTAAAAQVTSPAVVAALERFFAIINVSTGLAHPSDRDSAIRIFRELKDAGQAYTGTEVRAWLVRKGMSPSHADDVAKIAVDPYKARFHGK
jgi:hypothetical protein